MIHTPTLPPNSNFDLTEGKFFHSSYNADWGYVIGTSVNGNIFKNTENTFDDQITLTTGSKGVIMTNIEGLTC